MSAESCHVWRERMQVWLRGQGMPGDREAIAAHRAQCPDCEAWYRNTAELLAQIRQGDRAELPAEEPAHKPRRRRNLLIALGLPIFALLLWNTVQRKLPERQDGLRAQHSGVRVDGLRLAEGVWIEPRESSRVELEASARAELRLAGAEASIEGPARCTLERLKPLRVRVLEGAVRARGDARLVSNLAELTLEGGEAVLELRGGLTFVRALSAGVQLTDTRGTRLLLAGEELQLP
jgi:ferric-dicitrate binding protein FerR (iron transport regulator)